LLADIADTRSWLASAALSEGNVQQAVSIYQQIQVEFEQRSAQNKADAYVIEKVFSCYKILASVYDSQGLTRLAFNKAFQAHQLLNQVLAQDPANQQWRKDLFYLKLLLMRLNSSLHDNRITYTPDAIRQQIDHEDLDSRSNAIIMVYWFKESALYYQNTNQWSQSDALLQQAIAYIQELPQLQVSNAASILTTAELELLQAAQLQHSGLHAQSLEACRRAKVLLEPLQRDKKPQLLQPFAKALSCLGELEQHPELQQLLKISAIKL
jgi:hypothetical protein